MSYDFGGVIGGFKKAYGCLDAELFNHPRRPLSSLTSVDTSEVAMAHFGGPCQRGHGKICMQIRANPGMELVKSAARVMRLPT